MEILLILLLSALAIYFFADVLIIFGIRLVAFALCALVVVFLFKLFAEFLIWLGFDGHVAWASLFAALIVGFLGWCAIRAIGQRASLAMESGEMSPAETVSLDSVRTGLVSAFSVLVCQATLSVSSGQVVVIPWLALILMILILTILDILLPSFLHRVASLMR